MRSALLFSVLSVALLSLVGWVRNEADQPATLDLDLLPVDEELELFVG
jgi:7,8-dihydro-6-hydroxymethylpterin-pyrophosphokinase